MTYLPNRAACRAPAFTVRPPRGSPSAVPRATIARATRPTTTSHAPSTPLTPLWAARAWAPRANTAPAFSSQAPWGSPPAACAPPGPTIRTTGLPAAPTMEGSAWRALPAPPPTPTAPIAAAVSPGHTPTPSRRPAPHAGRASTRTSRGPRGACRARQGRTPILPATPAARPSSRPCGGPATRPSASTSPPLARPWCACRGRTWCRGRACRAPWAITAPPCRSPPRTRRPCASAQGGPCRPRAGPSARAIAPCPAFSSPSFLMHVAWPLEAAEPCMGSRSRPPSPRSAQAPSSSARPRPCTASCCRSFFCFACSMLRHAHSSYEKQETRLDMLGNAIFTAITAIGVDYDAPEATVVVVGDGNAVRMINVFSRQVPHLFLFGACELCLINQAGHAPGRRRRRGPSRGHRPPEGWPGLQEGVRQRRGAKPHHGL